MRGEPRLIDFNTLAMQIALSRELSAVERDRHAVARERGNDRGLIAEPPKPAAFACDIPVRQPRNGKRLFEKALCAIKALGKMRTGGLHRLKKPFPAPIVLGEGGF